MAASPDLQALKARVVAEIERVPWQGAVESVGVGLDAGERRVIVAVRGAAVAQARAWGAAHEAAAWILVRGVAGARRRGS